MYGVAAYSEAIRCGFSRYRAPTSIVTLWTVVHTRVLIPRYSSTISRVVPRDSPSPWSKLLARSLGLAARLLTFSANTHSSGAGSAVCLGLGVWEQFGGAIGLPGELPLFPIELISTYRYSYRYFASLRVRDCCRLSGGLILPVQTQLSGIVTKKGRVTRPLPLAPTSSHVPPVRATTSSYFPFRSPTPNSLLARSFTITVHQL
eukprot:scaffold42033_cov37-Prasinocladus_malaysianus.AAC.2